jgi:peptidoglycan/LPS O-acetylase OafA/YrhL
MPGVEAAPPERERSNSGHLAVVNGLRGWAIVAVMYHHIAGAVLTPSGFASRDLRGHLFSPYALVSHGWLGVNLFFVLSGFVLMLPFARGERSMASLRDAMGYYGKRARRLLPLYYLVILLAMFLRPLHKLSSPDFWHDALRYLTFTFTFKRRLFFTWYNPVLWSLAVEVWFSIVFPLLVVAWRRFGLGVLAVALLFSFGVRFYAVWRYPNVPAVLHFMKDNLPGRLDDFVVGMALAVWSTRPHRPSLAKTLGGFAVALLLLTFAANCWDNILHKSLSYRYAAALDDIELLAFAALIGGLLACPSRWVASPFTSPPVQLLGMMSYSLYMWHAMGGRIPEQGPEDRPMYIALFLALSAVTYRFVEFPHKRFSELFLRYPRLQREP